MLKSGKKDASLRNLIDACCVLNAEIFERKNNVLIVMLACLQREIRK